MNASWTHWKISPSPKLHAKYSIHKRWWQLLEELTYTQTSWLWSSSSSSLRIGGRRQAIDYTHTGTLVGPGWIWIMDLSAFCKIRMCCVGSALLNIINLLHGKAWFVKIKRWKTLQVLGKPSFPQFNVRRHDYNDQIMTNMAMKLIAFVFHSFFTFPQKTSLNGCKITLFGVGFFASDNFQLVLQVACLNIEHWTGAWHWYLYDFSPEWVFMCFFRSLVEADEYSHWQHFWLLFFLLWFTINSTRLTTHFDDKLLTV